jgi:methylmalonyl-CoA mutase C-terminal domain/subunit
MMTDTSSRHLARPIRILVAKPGLDGHDRGAKVVAAALRDAGMEVIYTGLHQTPEMIARAAVQEDVDVVGLSVLSGAHMTLFPRVRALLDEAGRNDILLTGGGIIPEQDIADLESQGVGRLFGPGTPTSALIDYIESWAAAHLADRAATPDGRGGTFRAPARAHRGVPVTRRAAAAGWRHQARRAHARARPARAARTGGAAA